MRTQKMFQCLLIMLAVQALSCRHEKVTLRTSLPAVISGPGRTLWWIYRDGQEKQIQAPRAEYFFPKISPDGKKIVFTVPDRGNRDIWILNLDHGVARQLTSNAGHENQPIWSPDGKRITFSSTSSQEVMTRGGIAGIYWRAADGTGEEEFLGLSPGKWIFPFSWKKGGKILATTETRPDMQNFDIGMLSTEGKRPYSLLFKENYQEFQPQFSPDGQWLAYCSGETGELQIYVRPFPDVNKGGPWQISTAGGNSPRWSPDGKELFYLVGFNPADAVMTVKVKTKPTFSPGKPSVLLRGKYIGSYPNNGIPYDVHPDGRRFLMMKE